MGLGEYKGINVVGVQFRRAGKIYDFSMGDHSLVAGDQVVVETDRGPTLAKVVTVKYVDGAQYADGALKPIMRRASRNDMEQKGRLTPERVVEFTNEKVNMLNLDMRVLKGEVQFGGNKAIIYFTAPGRVDFRELVKELAGGLKTRIELKQVGPRDETKLLGGVGICGREYCCSSFLRDFVPVSIKMAKVQNLALNPTKVSGGCGRLLCCLNYENEAYIDLRRSMPPRGARVKWTLDGVELFGDVVRCDLLNQKVTVEKDDGQQETLSVKDVIVTAKGEGIDAGDAWGEDIDLDALKGVEDEGPSRSKIEV